MAQYTWQSILNIFEGLRETREYTAHTAIAKSQMKYVLVNQFYGIPIFDLKL